MVRSVDVRYLKALIVTAFATGVAWPLYPYLDPVNLVMVYLVGSAWAGLRLGRGASVVCAVANVAAFDFFFVPPRFSFYVAEAQYLFTLGAMLAIALLIAHLMERVRREALAAADARTAAERAALRNTLLASISHDLRTPLSAIAAAGHLIAQPDEAVDRHRRRVLGELIEEKAQVMSRLMSNVLDLMRLETAQAVAKAQWESVEDLVGAALRLSQHRLGASRVETRIPRELPLVHVDAHLIVQLLSNLLENAAKYTPAGSSLTVAAEQRDDALLLSVEDDGPGFRGENPESLFETFTRGRHEREVGGLGLGLAICRAIASLHGGTIKAMTGAQGGARFEIWLPLAAPASPPVAECA